MAIAFGAANVGSVLNNSSLSFSGPSVSGSNKIAFLAVMGVRASAINTPTWGGVSMTQIGSTISSETNRKLALFYILNPGNGVSTIAVSVTGSGSPVNVLAVASFYTGAQQSGVPDATDGKNSGSVSSITEDVTTVGGDAWVVGAACETGATVITPSTGVTQRSTTIGDVSNDSSLAFGDSDGPKSPAGVYSMTFTGGGTSGNLGIIMASFLPFVPVEDLPVLDTLAADDITKVSATLNGEITDVGVGSCVGRGFVYDTSSHTDPGDTDPSASDYAEYTTESGTFGTGVFDDAISSLTPETVYYVRAWAENADGFAYGYEVSFETLPQVFAISGVCTLNGAPVEGAIVVAIDSNTFEVAGVANTNSAGEYLMEGLEESTLYIVYAVNEVASVKYTALLQWDVLPYEVE